jgi:hypothetical protein
MQGGRGERAKFKRYESAGHITQVWWLCTIDSNPYKCPALQDAERLLVKPNLRKCRCYASPLRRSET